MLTEEQITNAVTKGIVRAVFALGVGFAIAWALAHYPGWTVLAGIGWLVGWGVLMAARHWSPSNRKFLADRDAYTVHYATKSIFRSRVSSCASEAEYLRERGDWHPDYARDFEEWRKAHQ